MNCLSRADSVVAPLRVAATTWPDEAKKWEHLQDYKVVAVVGSPEERVRALKQKQMRMQLTMKIYHG